MNGEGVYSVVSPLGPKDSVGRSSHNAYPADLSHRTVGFVWDYLFKGPVMFEAIKGEIRSRYEDVRFVDYTEFGNIHGIGDDEVLARLPERLDAHSVDIAVVAVGA